MNRLQKSHADSVRKSCMSYDIYKLVINTENTKIRGRLFGRVSQLFAICITVETDMGHHGAVIQTAVSAVSSCWSLCEKSAARRRAGDAFTPESSSLK